SPQPSKRPGTEGAMLKGSILVHARQHSVAKGVEVDRTLVHDGKHLSPEDAAGAARMLEQRHELAPLWHPFGRLLGQILLHLRPRLLAPFMIGGIDVAEAVGARQLLVTPVVELRHVEVGGRRRAACPSTPRQSSAGAHSICTGRTLPPGSAGCGRACIVRHPRTGPARRCAPARRLPRPAPRRIRSSPDPRLGKDCAGRRDGTPPHRGARGKRGRARRRSAGISNSLLGISKVSLISSTGCLQACDEVVPAKIRTVARVRTLMPRTPEKNGRRREVEGSLAL